MGNMHHALDTKRAMSCSQGAESVSNNDVLRMAYAGYCGDRPLTEMVEFGATLKVTPPKFHMSLDQCFSTCGLQPF